MNFATDYTGVDRLEVINREWTRINANGGRIGNGFYTKAAKAAKAESSG